MQDNLKEFLNDSVDIVAQRLLGCLLEREIDGNLIVARIVEVEAYDQTDVASHSYNGRTPRSDIMFGPAGYLYVYFIYGMHYCCNIVVGTEGYGAAVLIRAVEIVQGKQFITNTKRSGINLTNGPSKLCQALDINRALNGHSLVTKPMQLKIAPLHKDEEIVRTTRIGLSKGKDIAWRFFIKNNPYVSHQ